MPITGISSMATRKVLSELIDRYRSATGETVAIEAIGGVDAARRVQSGENFDLTILADNVVEKLETEGHLIAGSRAAFVRSPMAMAVRAGEQRPDIATEAAIRTAMTSAPSIGYSTGPSGVHLLTVLKSWGLDAAAEPDRFVQAKPGIPVATLIASGKAAIGIQQLSELLGSPGIDIVGILPPPVQSITIFSIGIGVRSANVAASQAFIGFLNAPEAIPLKRQFGMEPA